MGQSRKKCEEKKMWSNWPLYLTLIVSAARYARGIDRVPTLNTRHAQLSIRPCMHCAARTVHQECMCSLLCLVKSASEKYVNKVNRTKKKERKNSAALHNSQTELTHSFCLWSNKHELPSTRNERRWRRRRRQQRDRMIHTKTRYSRSL